MCEPVEIACDMSNKVPNISDKIKISIVRRKEQNILTLTTIITNAISEAKITSSTDVYSLNYTFYGVDHNIGKFGS